MDLNYLLGRHQHALHWSRAAPTSEARHAHNGLARGYADRVRTLQHDLGAAARLDDTL